MRKIFTILLAVLTIFTMTACGSEEQTAAVEKETKSETSAPTTKISSDKKILVAYFSCTGTTKTLAENAAEVLNADLYAITPKIPYTEEDLNWHDETTRATVEQRDESVRPELMETDANFDQYDTIVIAFPIWWGIAPRIIDSFVENYDFSGKTLIPICTSGGSDIGTSGDYLKQVAKGSPVWKDGKSFMKNGSKEDLKNYFDGLGL